MADDSNTLYIYPVDEVHIQLDGDRGLLLDLYSYFTYDVPGHEWTYAYINKMWDGKKHLICNRTFKIYKGLLPYIEAFALEKGWLINKDPSLEIHNEPFDAVKFCDSLKLSKVPFDFQYEAIQKAVDDNRHTFESATSSGKSLIIYCLARYYMKKFNLSKKILVTEPTTGLVQQMLTDWASYCPTFPIEKLVHQVYDGASLVTNKPIIISTWQAMMKCDVKYLDQFGTIINDEAHGCKADQLVGILERAKNCVYRHGFTGTLDETECHRLVIEGLTGKAVVVSRTKDLMERGIVSELTIKCMVLKYSDQVRESNKKFTYANEMDFIVNCPARNRFIANLIGSIKPKENTLILTEYHNKKKHCDILKSYIERTCPNKKIVIVNGATKEDPEELRTYIESNSDVVIIATFGVFSTGRSINNIQNIVYTTYSKKQIKVLQSLGRGLRLDGKENKITAFDLVDDFGWRGHKCHLLRHFFERVRIYIKEGLKYKVFPINIID